MTEFLTLRQLVERHLRTDLRDPEPPEILQGPTEESFERHKVSLQESIDEATARREKTLAWLGHYEPLLEAALRWEPGAPKGGPIWSVREAVVSDLQHDIYSAKSNLRWSEQSIEYHQKRLAEITKESYFADVKAQNKERRKWMKESHKRASDQVDAFRRHAEAALASFEESQK
jgi:hypothetical protein